MNCSTKSKMKFAEIVEQKRILKAVDEMNTRMQATVNLMNSNINLFKVKQLKTLNLWNRCKLNKM